MKKYYYEDYVKDFPETKSQADPYKISIPLGINEKGTLEWMTMDQNTLITGGSGCGRGELLYSLIYSIITLYSHTEAQLWLYDSELHSFDWLSEYKVPHVACYLSEESTEATAAFLDNLISEFQRRLDILFSCGYHSFGEYFAATGTMLVPHAVVIIDFSELFFKHLRELPKEYGTKFGNLLLFSEALNISVTLCSCYFKFYLWGGDIHPLYFPNRIGMIQSPHSIERTMDCAVANNLRPNERTDLLHNLPYVHRVTVLTLYNTVVDQSLKKKFGVTLSGEVCPSDD